MAARYKLSDLLAGITVENRTPEYWGDETEDEMLLWFAANDGRFDLDEPNLRAQGGRG